MRYIPQSILDKIKTLLQTPANDADPRINLVLQRSHRYVDQAAMMTPVTLWERDNLGPISVAYRRESHLGAPDFVYLAYIDAGQAHVARQPYIASIEARTEWEYLYPLGPAVDVAIEFDGRWQRTSKDAEVCFDSPAIWSLVTFGEPYYFLVRPGGSLVVQQGQGEPFELATGASKVAALRGWKNVYRHNHDQGLICAYIRGGTVYYRNFCMQGDDSDPQPAAWEIERDPGLPTPAQDVAIFRTNDYRVGFLCESAGEIHWRITDRNWAGMAIPPHTISARGDGVKVDFIPIDYKTVYSPPHTITASGHPSALYCPAIWPQVVSVSNPSTDDTVTILIECDLPLYGDLTGLQAAFTVKDSLGTAFAVTATAKGLTDNVIMLTVANFEGAYGDLTLTYTHATGPVFAQVEGGCLMELADFTQTFTPLLAPPEGFTAHTITATGTGVKADFILVTYHNYPDYTHHAISVTAGAIKVDFIHVDDIVT